MGFALAYISKWLGLKGCMACHLFDGSIFLFPSAWQSRVQDAVRIEHEGFGLKLTACYKSKMCHSTTDSP